MATSTDTQPSPAAKGSGTAERALALAGLALLACYIVPLYAPPGPQPAMPPLPAASMPARLFPGVPPWWILSRLLALALGTAMLARACAGSIQAGGARSPLLTPLRRPSAGPRSERIALGLAAALALAAPWAAGSDTRAVALGYLLALALPVIVLALGSRRSGQRIVRARGLGSGYAAGAAVAALWVATRFAALWRSSRAADAVDAWDGYACFTRAAAEGFNIVGDGCYAGYTELPMIVRGISLLGTGPLPLSFSVIQLVHIAWMVACALMLSGLAARTIGSSAAWIAPAAFLFSPFIQRVPLMTSAAFIFIVYTCALLALLLRFARSRSPASLATLAIALGLAARCPSLYLVAPLTAVGAIAVAVRGPLVSRSALATAALLFLSVVGPGLPGPTTAAGLFANYADSGAGWAAMEATLFGQISAERAEGVVRSARAATGDIAAGLVLSPFATPRTAVRLWGDAMLEPIGAALAALGLLAALLRGRRSPTGFWLLLLLAATMAPGLASSYDRPSLIRVAAMTVPMALLASLGFDVLLRSLRRPPSWIGPALAAAMLTSGVALFDVVNPRILARSALGIVVDAWQPSGALPRAVVSDRSLTDPARTRMIVEQLGPPSLAIAALHPGAAGDDEQAADDTVVFWSPGNEIDASLATRFCRLRPGGRVLTLSDRAGLSSAFAFDPTGTWTPRSAAGQWQAEHCPTAPSTEAARGDAAIGAARRLLGEGRNTEAAMALRTTALATIDHPALFDTLARALLAHAPTASLRAEAPYWARRACAASRISDPEPCVTLADAQAALGDLSAAIDTARAAKESAQRRGNETLAAAIEAKIGELARRAREQAD